MKVRLIMTILLTVLFCFSCTNEKGKKNVTSSEIAKDNLITKPRIEEQIQKRIKLDYDFAIKVGQKEDFDRFETYTLFILTFKNKQLFIDTSLTEYEFGDSLYPFVRQLNNDTFEIFVEVNDRPNKNYLKYFKTYQDRIITTGKLPTFISKPSNLDLDDNIEVAGFMYYGETFGDDDNPMTNYNPIIYYELMPNGINLDSALTIRKIEEIYGFFHGFNYDDGPAVKISENKKWDNEVERIKKK